MKKVLLLVLLCLVVSACEKKGDKGDTGDDGMTSTKTYTGTPTSNPYIVTLTDINLATQVITVYMTMGSTIVPLPNTEPAYSDWYMLNEAENKIAFYTQKSDATVPYAALYHSSAGQYSYKIVVKTFNSVPARSAYLTRCRLDTSTANAILFGREVY